MSISTEIRISIVENIVNKQYEPECQRKCYLNVWRNFVFPQTGISLSTYNRYLKIIKKRKTNEYL